MPIARCSVYITTEMRKQMLELHVQSRTSRSIQIVDITVPRGNVAHLNFEGAGSYHVVVDDVQTAQYKVVILVQ